MVITDKSIGEILNYCEPKQDNDYNYYYFVKSDVFSYDFSNSKVNYLIQKWRDLLEGEKDYLFIKRNRLFFTIDGKKFYLILSSFSNEWRHIQTIINEFSDVSPVEAVTYLFGELD